MLHYTREIHNLDPQPHRYCMLTSTASVPRVTRWSLGLCWSRDLCSKYAAERLAGWLGDVILSRSNRLPRRWGEQAARMGYTGYLWLIVRGSEIWWCMPSAHSLSTTLRLYIMHPKSFSSNINTNRGKMSITCYAEVSTNCLNAQQKWCHTEYFNIQIF